MKTSQVIERLLYSININTLYFSHLTNHLQTYHLDINVNYNTCFFSQLYAIEQKNYDQFCFPKINARYLIRKGILDLFFHFFSRYVQITCQEFHPLNLKLSTPFPINSVFIEMPCIVELSRDDRIYVSKNKDDCYKHDSQTNVMHYQIIILHV